MEESKVNARVDPPYGGRIDWDSEVNRCLDLIDEQIPEWRGRGLVPVLLHLLGLRDHYHRNMVDGETKAEHLKLMQEVQAVGQKLSNAYPEYQGWSLDKAVLDLISNAKTWEVDAGVGKLDRSRHHALFEKTMRLQWAIEQLISSVRDDVDIEP